MKGRIDFKHLQTNGKAERLNKKIERFLSNSYGAEDLDFTLSESKVILLSTSKKELTQIANHKFVIVRKTSCKTITKPYHKNFTNVVKF